MCRASLPPGSDVACLSLLGYDPLQYFTGRAPLEAAAQGIALGPNDWAVRCNLVTIEDQMMREFTAGHISTDEARSLLSAAQEQLGSDEMQFYTGVSYRNLMVCRGDRHPAPFSSDTRTTPPHDLTDKSVLDDYPRGPGQRPAEPIDERQRRPVRRASGERPPSRGRQAAGHERLALGPGRTPALRPFAEVYHGCRGAMITAVDLLRGLAALMGWRRIEVPGATGYTDTDYAAKGRYAIEALADTDLICVHVEATDEASHEGDAAAKIRALEEIDRHIVGPLHDGPRRARRISHPDLARPSDAAAHQDAQPRRRAVRDLRHRHRRRRRNDLRRSRRRQFAAGLRSRLEIDGIFSSGE